MEKSMEINGHQWTSMDIQRKSNEHHGQSVTVCLRWWACAHAHFCCIKLIRLPFFGAKAIPSGKLTQLWKITIFNGKIAIFNSYVKLPEGME